MHVTVFRDSDEYLTISPLLTGGDADDEYQDAFVGSLDFDAQPPPPPVPTHRARGMFQVVQLPSYISLTIEICRKLLYRHSDFRRCNWAQGWKKR